jgi:23S rRNA (guanosine2251-2'-O)-methyltransferase
VYRNNRRKDIVFGRQPVLELFESGAPVDKVYLAKNSTGESIGVIRVEAKQGRVPLQVVPKEALNRMTGGNHQGVIAVTSEVTYQQLEDIVPHLYEQGKVPFFLLLDGITDVRNFGAIARTALASGAHAVVVGMRDAAPSNAEAVRTSAGALLKLNVCRERTLKSAIDMLKMNGIPCYGLDAKGTALPWESNLKEPIALVLGSEESGISQNIQDKLDGLIKLPINSKLDSYNVSVAAGMVCYETMKQRG